MTTTTQPVLTDAVIWAHKYDLTGDVNQVALDCQAEELDGTNFGSSGWKEVVAGIKSTTCKINGFLDTTIIEPAFDAFHAAGTTLVTVGVDGNQSSVAYFARNLESKQMKPGGKVGDLTTIEGDFVGDSKEGLLRGQIIAVKTTSGSSSNVTGVSLGAVSSTQKIYSALHVFSASGSTPSLTVKLKSGSTLGGSYTDRITHTAFTSAGSELASLAGAVTDTYWRADWTISGSTPSFTFALVAAII